MSLRIVISVCLAAALANAQERQLPDCRIVLHPGEQLRQDEAEREQLGRQIRALVEVQAGFDATSPEGVRLRQRIQELQASLDVLMNSPYPDMMPMTQRVMIPRGKRLVEAYPSPSEAPMSMEAVRVWVDELYHDLGEECRALGFTDENAIASLNWKYQCGYVLGTLYGASVHPALAEDVRSFLRDSLLAYAGRAIDEGSLGDPSMEEDVAEVLFNASGAGDEEAYQTVLWLYHDALAWCQELDYRDDEASTRKRFEALVFPDEALAENNTASWALPHAASQPSSSAQEELRKFRASLSEYRRRHCDSPKRIREFYFTAVKDYGSDAINSEFVATFLLFCQQVIVKAQKYPDSVKPVVITQIDLVLQSLSKRLSGPRLWKQWCRTVRSLERGASAEMRALVEAYLRSDEKKSVRPYLLGVKHSLMGGRGGRAICTSQPVE